MADIILINPGFELSFWGLEHALPLIGKRAALPVAALPLIAALTPPQHHITIIDENIEAIDFARCARADIVGLTGMIVQRSRMRQILTELKRYGAFTVVGGPWVSVSEDYFGDLADVIFVGEAEETWPCFLSDWEKGSTARRYEQSGKTDMTKTPVPRFDLLKMQHYAFGSVQFSRGCPFQCEFCDIIVVFGRRPRLKTPQQIIGELEALRAHSLSIVFIVDDNLIGNKREIKKLLCDVIEWQKANGFPLTFVTEASIDLADDEELMRLMTEANITAVFVGIESPNEESLRETRKLQNLRRGGTMVEKVHRIQEAGMEVWAGLILGFDNDDERIFAAHRRFVGAARISMAMVGMLSAIPTTPLHARLAASGRLDSNDPPDGGTNVLPAKMTRKALSDGYVHLVAELYDAEAYFDRVDDLYIKGAMRIERGWQRYSRYHPWRRHVRHARRVVEALWLILRLLCQVPEKRLRRIYWQRFTALLRQRPDPSVMRIYAIKCAVHYHTHRLVEMLRQRGAGSLNTF